MNSLQKYQEQHNQESSLQEEGGVFDIQFNACKKLLVKGMSKNGTAKVEIASVVDAIPLFCSLVDTLEYVPEKASEMLFLSSYLFKALNSSFKSLKNNKASQQEIMNHVEKCSASMKKVMIVFFEHQKLYTFDAFLSVYEDWIGLCSQVSKNDELFSGYCQAMHETFTSYIVSEKRTTSDMLRVLYIIPYTHPCIQEIEQLFFDSNPSCEQKIQLLHIARKNKNAALYQDVLYDVYTSASSPQDYLSLHEEVLFLHSMGEKEYADLKGRFSPQIQKQQEYRVFIDTKKDLDESFRVQLASITEDKEALTTKHSKEKKLLQEKYQEFERHYIYEKLRVKGESFPLASDVLEFLKEKGKNYPDLKSFANHVFFQYQSLFDGRKDRMNFSEGKEMLSTFTRMQALIPKEKKEIYTQNQEEILVSMVALAEEAQSFDEIIDYCVKLNDTSLQVSIAQSLKNKPLATNQIQNIFQCLPDNTELSRLYIEKFMKTFDDEMRFIARKEQESIKKRFWPVLEIERQIRKKMEYYSILKDQGKEVESMRVAQEILLLNKQYDSIKSVSSFPQDVKLLMQTIQNKVHDILIHFLRMFIARSDIKTVFSSEDRLKKCLSPELHAMSVSHIKNTIDKQYDVIGYYIRYFSKKFQEYMSLFQAKKEQETSPLVSQEEVQFLLSFR